MSEKSAGVVVERGGKYLLLHYESGHWDFPKGHIETGESAEAAALRELKEETGLEGDMIKGFSESINYLFKREGKLISKDVIFFVAKPADGKVVLSREHTGFVWLPFEDALEKLTYDTAKGVLRKAHGFLRKHA